MTETLGREIAVEGVDPRELYGAQNVYLEQIKALHPQLRIVARVRRSKCYGPEAETQRFAARMEGLAAYYLKYGHISPQVIDQCFGGRWTDAPLTRTSRLRQQRQYHPCLHGQPAEAGVALRAQRPAVRRRAGRVGQDDTAIALAVRALKEKEVRRIILTRPAVEAGEKLGFLPGDMKEKSTPTCNPSTMR